VKPVYHPEFKASFDEALAWYRAISPDLGDRFRSEIRRGVREIASGLVLHAPGPHGFRCLRCKRFPYLIYYQPAEKAVWLLAVLYAGRDTGYLGRRLADFSIGKRGPES
jgi:hypothetical protein